MHLRFTDSIRNGQCLTSLSESPDWIAAFSSNDTPLHLAAAVIYDTISETKKGEKKHYREEGRARGE